MIWRYAPDLGHIFAKKIDVWHLLYELLTKIPRDLLYSGRDAYQEVQRILKEHR